MCRTRRQRSRSPGQRSHARRMPATAGPSAAVFQNALRQAAPESNPSQLQVKQELFNAPQPQPLSATNGVQAAQIQPLGSNGAVVAPVATGAAAAANGTVTLQPTIGGLYAPVATPELDPNSVVVMNVHFDATPEQLGMFFHERCGDVLRVTILKNAHGMPKGYAYMQLASAAAAHSAQQLSGEVFMGRTLRVRLYPARNVTTLVHVLRRCLLLVLIHRYEQCWPMTARLYPADTFKSEPTASCRLCPSIRSRLRPPCRPGCSKCRSCPCCTAPHTSRLSGGPAAPVGGLAGEGGAAEGVLAPGGAAGRGGAASAAPQMCGCVTRSQSRYSGSRKVQIKGACACDRALRWCSERLTKACLLAFLLKEHLC